MAKITVRPVGRRAVGMPHCVVCGSTRELKPGSGVCQNMCHWNLSGWVAWDALLKKVRFLDHRALVLAQMHRWDPETKTRSAKPWPRIVAAARALGWSGDTASGCQPTFIDAGAF